jgi:hypothetical protein
MKIKNILSTILLTTCMLLSTGCQDFLTTTPTSSLSENQIVNDMTGIKMLLQGTYRQMRDGAGSPNFYSPEGIKAVSTTTGVDIMINDEQIGDFWYFTVFGSQRYDPTATIPTGMWVAMYKVISNTNTIIYNIDNIKGDASEKGAVKGQALAIRARCYYNLIRFYQHTYIIAKTKPGVPLLLEPTLKSKARNTVEEVYTQIVADLKNAETLLASYQRPDKQYYNKDVVQFFLADVYLTMNNWAEAQKYANKIRTSYELMTIDEYKAGFSTTNREWVLGYVQTSQDYWWYDSPACWYDFGQTHSPWQAELFIPTKHFVEVVMKDDPRNLNISNPLYPGKYAATKFIELKSASPYGDLYDLRAAEMYLIEAEAAARQGAVDVAKTVLNQLQSQRGAAVTTTTDKTALIDAIILERRKEMWGEGLDYFDIMRLQKPVVKTVADGNYQEVNIPANSNKLIMMIPEKEMINNSAMVQNPNPAIAPVFVP